MSVFTDVSVLAFATSGVNGVVRDYQQLENEALKLERLQERAYYATAGSGRDRAQEQLRDHLRNAAQMEERVAFQESIAMATAAAGILKTEVRLVQEAVEAYESYGAQIRTIQAISGGTARQSEQFANLAKVAGVGDGQSLREITKLAQDMQSNKGRQALSQLGITPGAGENELQTFQRVIGALGHMQDGARKTRLEIDLWGQRGVVALQPLLQMSGDISERTLALSANIDQGALASITHLQQSTALLGQTVLVDLVAPLAQKLVPALDWVVNSVQWVIVEFHKLDDMTGGLFTWIAIVGGIAVAFGLVAVSVGKLISVMKALQIVETAEIGIQMVLDALKGPAGWVALGVAAAVGGAYAYSASQSGGGNSGGGEQINGAANTFRDASNNFADAVNAMKSWSQVGGSQLPSQMTAADYAFICQQRARGAVG